MTINRWTWVAGCVVLGLAAAGYQQAGGAPDVAFDSLGSRAVPYFVSAALFVLAVLMMVEEAYRAWRQRDESDLRQPAVATNEPSSVAWPLWAVGGLLGTYVAVLAATDIPFWVATLIFLFSGGSVLDRQRSSGWRLTALVAIMTAAVVQSVFTWLLIDLP